MLLKKSIQKTKHFFHRTLQTLKSFLFGGYQNLPKTLVLNPLSCNNDPKNNQLDHIHTEFCSQWGLDHPDSTENVVMKSAKLTKTSDAYYGSGRSVKIADEATAADKQETQTDKGKRVEPSFGFGTGGIFVLAKMKGLEMIDMADVDQSLDIEEALHYYSRLTCPIYLDIVDKFFMDIYTESFLPQPSSSISNSSRRLNSSCRLWR